jgi:hypothetical protein
VPTKIWESDEGEVEEYIDDEFGESTGLSITIMVPATFEWSPKEPDIVYASVWLDRRTPAEDEVLLHKAQEYDVIQRLIQLTNHPPTREE